MSTKDPTHPQASRQPLTRTAISVRWRDLDALNHVNNSNYLTYLEEARLQWLQQLHGEWTSEHCVGVVAASELNYRLPIGWPAQIEVELYLKRIGHSSLSIGHRIVNAADNTCVYCDGHVVVVWINPATGRSQALPQAIRDALA